MIDTEFLSQQAKYLTVDKVCFQPVYWRVAFRKVGFTGGWTCVKEEPADNVCWRNAVLAFENNLTAQPLLPPHQETLTRSLWLICVRSCNICTMLSKSVQIFRRHDPARQRKLVWLINHNSITLMGIFHQLKNVSNFSLQLMLKTVFRYEKSFRHETCGYEDTPPPAVSFLKSTNCK